MEYRNAIILVTGGSSGIGRAFVDRFLREGATVVACGRDEAKLQGLKAQHPSVEIRPCDITSSDEVKALIAFLTQEYGRLDILVNNAGVMEQVHLLSGNVGDEAIAREIATNLTAPILLTRRLVPLLQQSNDSHGHVRLCLTARAARTDLLCDQGGLAFLHPRAPVSARAYGYSRRRNAAASCGYAEHHCGSKAKDDARRCSRCNLTCDRPRQS
jgi:NAD(P)-dependent dehydrogenase (short-subunit alcohol dehydrogenase family)